MKPQKGERRRERERHRKREREGREEKQHLSPLTLSSGYVPG